MNQPDITDLLPTEVLVHIFNFLPRPDLKDARLVCKQWYTASLHTNIARNEKLFVQIGKADVAALLNSQRYFRHITITSKNFIWSRKKLWSHIGEELRSLTVVSCKTEQGRFYHALTCCPNLEVLKIKRFLHLRSKLPWRVRQRYSLEKPTKLPDFQLPMLHTFVLHRVDSFDEALCQAVVSRAPNLKSFVVNLFLTRTPLLCYDFPAIAAGTAPTHFFDRLMAYARKNPKIEFELTIQFGFCPEPTLFQDIIKLPNIRLRRVIAVANVNLPCLHRREDLKALDIRFNACDLDMKSIYLDCTEIESLCFLSSGCGVHRGLCFLFMILQHLTTLEIWLPETITDQMIMYGLCKPKNKLLKVLKIGNFCRISENCFVEVMKYNPTLTCLKLRCSHCTSEGTRLDCRYSTLTDWSVQAIFKYQETLETLSLHQCTDLTDAGLSGEFIQDSERQDINPTGNSISRLKRLKNLSIQHGRNIAGSSLMTDFRFPAIRRFFILNNDKISNEALKGFIENNRTIEKLELVKFGHKDTGINDVIPVILKHLWRLKVLNITSTKVCESNLLAIKGHYGPSLKIIQGFKIVGERDYNSDPSDNASAADIVRRRSPHTSSSSGSSEEDDSDADPGTGTGSDLECDSLNGL